MDIISYLLGKNSGGSGGINWSEIGYSSEPQTISDDFAYSKQIYDEWDSSQTDLSNKFRQNKTIVYMPLVDTSNVEKMFAMFYSCSYLQVLPLLDTSKVTDMQYLCTGCNQLKVIPILNTTNVTTLYSAFGNCNRLTDESLDNILQMCINATNTYTATKSLSSLGFLETSYPVSRIEALPHYQDFIDSGWTIGY